MLSAPDAHAPPSPNAGASGWPADHEVLRLLLDIFTPYRLSPGVVEHLMDESRTVHCDVGPLPYASPRRPEPSWWLVTRGQVRAVQRDSHRGRPRERIVGPGEWLDIASAMSTPGTWIENAVCLTPVSLLLVPVSALFGAGRGDGGLAVAAATLMAERLRSLSVPQS